MKIRSPLKTISQILFLKAPIEAQLIITRRCNLSCGYCTEYDSVSPPVPLDALKERIDKLHELKVTNLSLLGGEPLMHPDLASIISYGNRLSQVSVTTNGFLITEDLIKKLNHVGLSNMEVSIDQIEKDKTGFIQKNYRTLQPKLELLKKFATFDVHLNLVLCEQTKHQFRETIDEFKKFGFFVSIDILHNEKGGVEIGGGEYLDLWEYYYQSGVSFSYLEYEYGKAILSGQKPKWKCRAGSRSLYIDEYGNVQYCSAQRGKLNQPLTHYTRADILREHHQYKGCESGCSLLCVYRDSMLDNFPIKTLKGAIKTISVGAALRAKPTASKTLSTPSLEKVSISP